MLRKDEITALSMLSKAVLKQGIRVSGAPDGDAV